MKTQKKVGCLIIVGLIVGMTAGCMNLDSASSGKAKFYALEPSTPDSEMHPVNGLSDIKIGIGPVSIPPYLNRPQIVTRVGPHEISVSEFHLWAEPLQTNILRVLGENMAEATGSDQVVTFPWKQSYPTDYQITVSVIQFDATKGANLTLKANWVIYGNDGREQLLSRRFDASRSLAEEGYSRMVGEMSRILADLSKDMVMGLNGVIPKSGEDTP